MVLAVTCNNCKREFAIPDNFRIIFSFWYVEEGNDIHICPGCLLHDVLLGANE